MILDNVDAIERLDAYLDAVALGSPAAVGDVDPELIEIDRRFRRLDDAPALRPVFGERLWEELTSGPAAPSPELLPPHSPTPLIGRRPTWRSSERALSNDHPIRGWAFTHLATAALLVLTLGGVFVAVGGRQIPGFAPASRPQGPGAGAANTASYRGGPARTGVDPGPGPAGLPTTRWKMNVYWAVKGAPVVAGGIVYVATTDDSLYAFDAATGQQRWWFYFTGSLPPAVVDGVVYAGSPNQLLTALDATTGKERWSLNTGSVISAAPAVVDGVVYVGLSVVYAGIDGAVIAVDAASGHELWRYETHGPVTSAPAVVDGMVYIGSGGYYDHDTALLAIEARTGQERWRFVTGGSIFDAPAVAGGIVYVNSAQGLFAIDAASGTERWRLTSAVAGRTMNAQAIAQGLVYAVLADQKLSALDAKTGAVRWQSNLAAAVISAPTVAGNAVYVATADGFLVALDAATGAERWRFGNGDQTIDGAPAIVDGMIYFGARSSNTLGSFYALAEPTASSPASS